MQPGSTRPSLVTSTTRATSPNSARWVASSTCALRAVAICSFVHAAIRSRYRPTQSTALPPAAKPARYGGPQIISLARAALPHHTVGLIQLDFAVLNRGDQVLASLRRLDLELLKSAQ